MISCALSINVSYNDNKTHVNLNSPLIFNKCTSGADLKSSSLETLY